MDSVAISAQAREVEDELEVGASANMSEETAAGAWFSPSAGEGAAAEGSASDVPSAQRTTAFVLPGFGIGGKRNADTQSASEVAREMAAEGDHGRSRSPRHVRSRDACTLRPKQRARSEPAHSIEDHVFDGSGAGAAEHAHPVPRIRPSHFHYLKQAVANATQVPLTHAELSTASARGPGLKPATGGKWPTCMETISRCVAAYHHKVNAGERNQSLEIAATIGQYAHTLRQMVHEDDCLTFVTLLHAWIENRALNMALRSTFHKAFEDDPFWNNLSDADRGAAVNHLEIRQEAVRAKSDELRAAMAALRADAGRGWCSRARRG